jgi:hypothetical protein
LILCLQCIIQSSTHPAALVLPRCRDMEVDPLGLHPPLPIRSNLSLREAPKRNASAKDQKSQKVLGRDMRTRRSPTYGRAADNNRPGVRTSPIAGHKPLIPAGERESGEQGGNKATRSPIGEKWSPSVEGSAVGREGRHFTVANVGNNGQIFLRCVVPDQSVVGGDRAAVSIMLKSLETRTGPKK